MIFYETLPGDSPILTKIFITFHPVFILVVLGSNELKKIKILKQIVMKAQNIYFIGLFFIASLFQSCDDGWTKVSGEGPIVSKTLDISDFSKIYVQGVDDVHIEYGETQKVEVKGQANIISLIETDVVGDTWYVELEDGSYGNYDLTYYITVPLIESIRNSGTGDIFIDSEMTQTSIDIKILGTGDYYGYDLSVDECTVSIIGTGSAEVTANSELDVKIEGTGNVYYKGHPTVSSSITGTGSVMSEN